MSKFMNRATDCLDEGLEGFVMTHCGLRLVGDQRVVVSEKVLLV